MILYHFSDKDLQKISIEYFGINSYTKNDTKYTTKRFFCYDSIQPFEYHLQGSKYRYTLNIDDTSIYNLDDDILDLKEKFNYNIDDILKYISKNFIGCYYNIGFFCYCVFKDIIPIEKHEYINQNYVKA